MVVVDSTGRPINTSVLTGDPSGKVENIFDLNKINSEFAIGTALTQETSTFLSNRAQELDDAQKAYNAEWNKGDQADPEKLAQLGKAADDAKQWGSGGTYRLVFTAITGGLTGNLGGSASDALGSAAANVIQGLGAQQVKDILSCLPQGDPGTEVLRTALQGILGCAGGAGTGNCASGALGASASVVLGNLANFATGQNGADLPQEQKDQLSKLLTTVVAGTTSAAGGNAAAATLAARVELENNYAAVLRIVQAEAPAYALKIRELIPGLAQLIFSVNANDGSGSATDAKPGEGLFETNNGQGGGSPGEPGKDPSEDKFTKALRTIDETRKAPEGFKGGGAWQNDGRGGTATLPRTDASGNPITYKEWDVNVWRSGVNRGTERIVTGSDGGAFMTNNQYFTFVKMR